MPVTAASAAEMHNVRGTDLLGGDGPPGRGQARTRTLCLLGFGVSGAPLACGLSLTWSPLRLPAPSPSPASPMSCGGFSGHLSACMHPSFHRGSGFIAGVDCGAVKIGFCRLSVTCAEVRTKAHTYRSGCRNAVYGASSIPQRRDAVYSCSSLALLTESHKNFKQFMAVLFTNRTTPLQAKEPCMEVLQQLSGLTLP